MSMSNARTPKTTYLATASNGSVVEFESTRTSTHAVMVQSENREGETRWGLLSTNGRYELAAKELAKWASFVARNPNQWDRTWWDGVSGVEQRFLKVELVELTTKA